jgi:hypothetical protein
VVTHLFQPHYARVAIRELDDWLQRSASLTLELDRFG